MPIQSQRPADKMAKESFSRMGKSFVLINKSKIKSWQTVLILGFIAGFLAAIIWAVSYDVQPRTSAALRNNLKAVPPASDFDIFQSCYGQPATSNCAKADFDKNGAVGISDYGLMKGALQYDLNGDSVINLSNNTYYPSDFKIFQSCFGQPATGNCLKSDFDKNGAVGISDYGLMKGALQYDLNGDGIVNLINIQNLQQTDMEIFQSCFGKIASSSVECLKSDFDKDGAIGISDFGLMKSALQYDLNGDNVINLSSNANYPSDMEIFQSCFGQSATSSVECAKADFDKDGAVGISDFGLIKSALQYDLNGDNIVDLNI